MQDRNYIFSESFKMKDKDKNFSLGENIQSKLQNNYSEQESLVEFFDRYINTINESFSRTFSVIEPNLDEGFIRLTFNSGETVKVFFEKE